MASELKINYYQLSPEEDILPVLRRPLNDDEICEEWETLLKVPAGDGYQRFAILSEFPFSDSSRVYTTHATRFERLPRLTRIKLLDDGLCNHFRERSCVIVRKKFCFDVYDKESLVPCSAHGIRLDRGLTFQQERVFKRDRPLHGYFITLKIRRSFANGLKDPALQSLSIGHRVFFPKTENAKGTGVLKAVSGNQASIDCDGRDISLPIDSVEVQARTELVRAYLAKSNANDYTQLLNDEQLAALRRTRGGQKRRDAIKAQSEYVMTWLIRNSDYGRVRFAWPFSDKRISMLTTPHIVALAEVS